MQLFSCCILLLLFALRCLYGSKLQLEKSSDHDNRNLLECLDVLIGVTEWAVHDFLVISDDTHTVDYEFFQRHENFAWKLYSAENNNFTGFFNVIFLTHNFHYLNETLGRINIQRMDGRAKFLISVARNFGSLDEINTASKGISAVMWKMDKTRVVYLVPCKEDILAMTYFPFAKNCQVGELDVLDVWKGTNFSKGVELFPEKMLDIRGCVQNHTVTFSELSSFHVRKEFTKTGKMILGGVGGKLISIVAEKMNMKLHTVILPPESWPMLTYEVGRGESLFSVSGNIPIARHLEILDFDSGYIEESFGLGYNVSGFEFSWKNLVWPLSDEVWLCTGYTGLLFCGLLFMGNRCRRSGSSSEKLQILHGFGIFLGISQALPRSFFGRYTFGMWIVYSYLINASYNSGLVSFLTTPREKSVINTFEELLADGIDFGGGGIHREFYHDPSDPVMMKIYNNFKNWSDKEGTRRLFNRQGVTGVLDTYVRAYNSEQSGNGNHQLRMLKEKALTCQVPISMRRGSPFTLGVRRYTSRAIQGGFHVYWLKYYTRQSSSPGIGTNTPTRISMRHARGILYVYIAGLSFSCIVFLGELIYHKYFQNGGLR